MKYLLFVMILRALLTLLVTAQASEASDAFNCNCNGRTDQVHIMCSNSNIPNNSGTTLVQVQASTLINTSSLTRLDLSSCQLDHIDSGAFQYLGHLQFMDISGNTITGLKTEHFRNLPNLRVVRLNGNARYECHKLRKALPEITFHCGPHVKTTKKSNTSYTAQATSEKGSPDVVMSSKQTPSTTDHTEAYGSTTTAKDASDGGHIRDTWWPGFIAGCGVTAGAAFLVMALSFARKNRFWISGRNSVY